MLVVIQVILSVTGNVEVFPPVVVVIAHANALAPARGGEAGLCCYIGECSIVVVVIEMIGRGFALWRSFESGSVYKENVGPSVIVIIEDGNASAGGFDYVFLGCESAEDVGKG